MKVWYNVEIKGVSNGPQSFEIEKENFEAVEEYMKNRYAADIKAQDAMLKNAEIIITPLYNEVTNGVSLKKREWFEGK